MTVLEITSFEIVERDAGTYAHICADVDVVVDTHYDGYYTIPTACEAMVLLADDTDLTAFKHEAEQMELAEDVSLWDYVDPSDDEIMENNSCGTPWHDGCM